MPSVKIEQSIIGLVFTPAHQRKDAVADGMASYTNQLSHGISGEHVHTKQDRARATAINSPMQPSLQLMWLSKRVRRSNISNY